MLSSQPWTGARVLLLNPPDRVYADQRRAPVRRGAGGEDAQGLPLCWGRGAVVVVEGQESDWLGFI